MAAVGRRSCFGEEERDLIGFCSKGWERAIPRARQSESPSLSRRDRVPRAPGREGAAMLAVSLAAYVLSLVEFIAFDRLPPWAFHALTAAGTSLVACALYFGGDASGFYRLLFVWVILFASYFFSPRDVALHVAFVAVAYGVVLFFGNAAELTLLAWFLTVATLAVVAALVLLLKARLDQLLAGEREQVERLRELDRLEDNLIGSVSHERRTPVTSIRRYSELMLEG